MCMAWFVCVCVCMYVCVLLFVICREVYSPRESLFTRSSYKFTTNSIPNAQVCTIVPPIGYAFSTLFNITCEPFVDDQQPLTYMFLAGSCRTLGTSSNTFCLFVRSCTLVSELPSNTHTHNRLTLLSVPRSTGYSLRSTDRPLLTVPRTRTSTAGRRFCCAEPLVWNTLPDSVVYCDTFRGFKRKLKTHLTGLAANW